MSIFSHFCRTSLSKPFHLALGKGFTLVELLVVVAIMLILTTFILVRHSRFDSTTLLRSLSYSIALSIRQAQVYGTSVRGIGSVGTVVYSPGFGVHLSDTEPTRYFLFGDADGNRAWQASETVTTQTLGRSFTIRDFCAVTAGGSTSCMSTGAIDWMTIYFRRPNPEAIIYTSNVGATYAHAYIQIQSSAESGVRSVKVTSVGQISVCGLDADINTC